MALIDEVKLFMGISSSAKDGEITELINDAKTDLSISGVHGVYVDDPLIKRAIKLYVKANFDLTDDKQERYQYLYESLRIHLALCGDYNVG